MGYVAGTARSCGYMCPAQCVTAAEYEALEACVVHVCSMYVCIHTHGAACPTASHQGVELEVEVAEQEGLVGAGLQGGVCKEQMAFQHQGLLLIWRHVRHVGGQAMRAKKRSVCSRTTGIPLYCPFRQEVRRSQSVVSQSE